MWLRVQMELGYRQRDEEGNPIRRSKAEIARLMGIPEKRWGSDVW